MTLGTWILQKKQILSFNNNKIKPSVQCFPKDEKHRYMTAASDYVPWACINPLSHQIFQNGCNKQKKPYTY